MSDQQEIEPIIRNWLGARLQNNDGHQIALPVLTAISLLVERDQDVEIPIEVLQAWRRMIVRQRRTVEQSEEKLIAQTRKQGLTWDETAKLLGLGNGRRAEEYHTSLVERLRDLNPEMWKV